MGELAGIYSLNEKINEYAVKSCLTTEKGQAGFQKVQYYNYGKNLFAGQGIYLTHRYQVEQVIEYQIDSNSYAILFDGRIDNREELVRLTSIGISSITSDAEIVLNLYHQKPEKFLKLLEGDFAVVIFDPQKNKILLARDALGMRNLFYRFKAGKFVWGSSLKQILTITEDSQLNNSYLKRFLIEQPTNREETPYKNIFRVEPGQAVTLAEGKLVKEKYYHLSPNKLSYKDNNSYIEHFYFLLSKSVENRMNSSDSKIGISLSGGLDSTSIASLAMSLISEKNLPVELISFSLVFDEFSEVDERNYIDPFIKEKGIRGNYIPGDSSWIFKDTFNKIKSLDEPYPLFTYSMSSLVPKEAAKKGISVLLDGHIGDHVLYGDLNYLAQLIKNLKISLLLQDYRKWNNAGHPLHELIIINTLFPLFIKSKAYRRLPWIYDREFVANTAEQYRKKQNIWDIEGSKAYYESIIRRSDVEWVNQYIPNQMGIEVRHPFYEKNLMEFLSGIPVELRITPEQTKHILREAMKARLPTNILNRTTKTSHSALINAGIRREWESVNKYLGFEILSDLGWLDGRTIRGFFEKWYLGQLPPFPIFTAMLRALSLEVWLKNKL
jgi:asparagine synthase (glutamine-hydrolysing)